jgi:predicted lipid-binding transport protein (Tim44 family)
MSAQIIELLFFATIAFLIINKLITMLGTSSSDDQIKQGTSFHKNIIKDVTNSLSSEEDIESSELKEFENIILKNKISEIVSELKNVRKKLPNFNLIHFVNISKKVFQMIIESSIEQKSDILSSLIDKRFITQFNSMSSNYINFNFANLSAKVSEIYMFGNNIFIKLLFSKVENNFSEEWTFSKSLISQDVNWILVNIEA